MSKIRIQKRKLKIFGSDEAENLIHSLAIIQFLVKSGSKRLDLHFETEI